MKNDIAFLKHIMDNCLFLIDFIEKTDFEDFISSEIYKRAAVRSIEITGEASKKYLIKQEISLMKLNGIT